VAGKPSNADVVVVLDTCSIVADKAWKRRERSVAAQFGTERTPLSGGNGKQTRSDTLHERLFIETKARERHAAVSLWDDTAEKAKKEGKVPVVALCVNGRPGCWFLVKDTDLQAVASEQV
jgi:hypothetical protein